MDKIIRINRSMASDMLPERDDGGNKGSFGCLVLLCGSRDMPGAACLSTSAAMRCGVGLAALASVPPVLAAAGPRLWEAVQLRLPETDGGFIAAGADDIVCGFKRGSAILAGCGAGTAQSVRGVISGLIEKSPLPMVIDADGLNCISHDVGQLSKRRGETVLTPHIGEMSRLTGLDIAEIKIRRAECAVHLTEKTGCVVVLKDSVTHVACPDGRVFLLDHPNSGLAKGGSGDVLAGCIGSFLAQGMAAADAAVLGVYVHSGAGFRACERLGRYGMQPGDVIDEIPYVIKELGDQVE